jgi:putative hydrolase
LDDLLLFLAIREAARQRLFAAVGWLGPQLLALVQHYASDIEIDPEAVRRQIEDQLGDNPLAFDASTLGEWQNAVGEPLRGLFSPARTPQQDEVLERLETLLALVEGWVDEVSAQVTKQRMPAAQALTEMLRRRSAEKGPVQIGLKTLVGIELSPRRARDAANLWAATRARRGSAERDATWRHPDLLPTVADLADPLGFAEHGKSAPAEDDFDSALAKLLAEEGPPESN